MSLVILAPYFVVVMFQGGGHAGLTQRVRPKLRSLYNKTNLSKSFKHRVGILGPPGNHASPWIRDLWSKGVSLILAYFQTFLSFCVLDDFFHLKKNRVFGYSWFTLLRYRCLYPHWSRDALSPVYRIFFYSIG